MSNDQNAVRTVLDRVREVSRTVLTAEEARSVCQAYGIATPGEGLAHSAAEAVQLARELDHPVVLKIASPDILHKTDAGGVVTGLDSDEAVAQAYEDIIAKARAYNPDANVLGVQVQQMVADAHQVIVGAVTDPSFGKLVAVGLGGVLVEVLRDVAFRLAPVTRDEARSMFDDLRGGAV